MKKLIICLLCAAFTATLLHSFQWEKTARTEWREYTAATQSQAADLKALGL